MTNGRALRVTAVLFVAGVLLDLLVGATPFPGFAALLGLISCSLIIILSKWLGKTLLQRPEGYYPDDAPADRVEDLRG